jgi:predicted MPP superfamily phosphohydrolase
MSRRSVVIRVMGVLVLSAVLLAARAFWLEPSSLSIDSQQIALPEPGLATLRIAVLTDLHVGSPFNGIDKLRRVVDLTNAAQPDLVCILGDLVIQGVRGGTFVPPEQIAGELKRLQATSGVFGVLGNHDVWLDRDRVANALAGNGVRLVENRAERIETRAGPVWVTGVSDLWTTKPDLSAALADLSVDSAPAILLTHNPDIFPDVPARVALTLAGHTHGGQVRFPFIGAPIIPSRFGQRFAAGHIVEGGRHLYVATGVGTSILPVRFRVAPAVALLTVVQR